MSDGVTISIEDARLIRKVFLPSNPRKMRKPHPDVLATVNRFIETLAAAEADEAARSAFPRCETCLHGTHEPGTCVWTKRYRGMYGAMVSMTCACKRELRASPVRLDDRPTPQCEHEAGDGCGHCMPDDGREVQDVDCRDIPQ